ncbi:MAG TPA: serine/threonine-protein kinase, partial [Polyangiaceae bacterium]|nr:serine/threonine-protein kinase [Polyangiaceae bacterium]
MVTLKTTRHSKDREELAETDAEARIGQVIVGKYRIDQLLGRGGMGAVYGATHTSIGKRVALKFLERDIARDRDAALRFQREAEAVSKVESAHIVQIFDSGTTEDGLPFLVMEHLQGEDLRARLRRESRLPPNDVVHIAGQVLRGLSRAHEAQIVHRDLKPDNIFLCLRDDDPVFVKIVDFGISKIVRENTVDTLTRRGTVLGTAFYMSPEQAQALRDIDGRADLYSLGAILYEALAGRPPHVGTAYEAVLISICTTDAPDVRTLASNVPEALARVVHKALRRDRNERYATANEFYEALSQAVPGILNSARSRRTPDVALSSRPPAETDAARSALFSADTNPDPAVLLAGGPDSPSNETTARTRRRTWLAGVFALLTAAAITTLLIVRARPSDDTVRTPAAEPSAPPAVVAAPAETSHGPQKPERETPPEMQVRPASLSAADAGVPVQPSASASPQRGARTR